MLFNSFAFAVFLPIVFTLYWAFPHKYRWAILLAASYYFYMSWNPKYIVLILFTTVISYTAALLIEGKTDKRFKDIILAIAAVLCLGVLFFFKYFNFVSQSVSDVMRLLSIKMNPVTLHLILPVGISFYTFQTLGYVIDVYRGDTAAEHHFGKYATFISFFPQLVAGPIERSDKLLPQIKAEHTFDYDQGTYGVKLMAWGYFKKMVVADTISQYIGRVYDMPYNYQGFSLVIAAVLFSFEIYCDFSGYSDIAIGTAKLMGIDLMTNFKSPYFSQSIREFWSRWHISLSTWFRDYVYIPLGGNRVFKLRNAFNIMVTFLTSGLWHGANWTFVIWGGIHGLAQIIENQFGFLRKRSFGFTGLCRVILVFIFSTIAWVFFASNSLSDTGYIFSHMLSGITNPIAYLHDGFAELEMQVSVLSSLVFSIVLLMVYDFMSLKHDCIALVSRQKPVVRTMIYFSLFFIIILFRASRPAEFVYFQF